MRSPEERPVPTWMNAHIDLYLNKARPLLLGASNSPPNALWISSHSRQPMKQRDVGKLITQLTEETIGVAISPHLFRTADATTAADARSDMPHLASALLNHKGPPITEKHYNRASSLNAANEYAAIVQRYWSQRDRPET